MNFLCTNMNRMSPNSERDIAFHLNPRFDQKVVVLNTFRNGNWDKEERPPSMVFDVDVTFAITIDCQHDCYKVSEPMNLPTSLVFQF